MRRLFGLVLAVTILQWQLYTTTAFALDSTTAGEIDLVAEATYGALFLNCKDAPGSDAPDNDAHAFSYDMFKVACANHIKDKVNIADRAKEMAESGDINLKPTDGQYDSFVAYASLARSMSTLMDSNSKALDDVDLNFKAVYEQAKLELEAKTNRVEKAESWVMKAYMIVGAAIAGLLTSLYFMITNSQICYGDCIPTCTGGALASYCFSAGESFGDTAVGYIESATAFWETIPAFVKWGGSMAVSGFMMFSSHDNKLKDQEEDMLEKILLSLDSLYVMIESSLTGGIDHFFSYTIDSSYAVCVNDASCVAAANWFTVSVTGLVASIGTLIYGVIDLLNAKEELSLARNHTHLECTGMKTGSTLDIDQVIPRMSLNRGEILEQFRKIRTSETDMEAYNRIRELKRIVSGNVVNSEPTFKELIFFEEATKKNISFKERGVMIGAKLIELIFAKDAFALTAGDLGYEEGFASYYNEQVEASGKGQLAAWPEPETRVDYLAALVAQSEAAAGGGGGAAAAAKKESDDAAALLARVVDQLAVEKGSDLTPGEREELEKWKKKVNDNITTCKDTGTCAKFLNMVASGLKPGSATDAVATQLASYDPKQTGDNEKYDSLIAKLKDQYKAMRDRKPSTEKRINNILKKAGKKPIDFNKGKKLALARRLQNRKSALGKTKGMKWAMLPQTKFNKEASKKLGDSLFGEDFKMDFGGFGAGGQDTFGDGDYGSKNAIAEGPVDKDTDAWDDVSKNRMKDTARGDQIHGFDTNIFDVITQRYIRSAYPMFMEER